MDSKLIEREPGVNHQTDSPKAKFFSLKTPYMVQGRMTPVVASTANLTLQVKVNAEGGENAVHAHLDEDHAFIVLEGQASIFDETGKETKLTRYQGVMLPKGAFYRYLNTGTDNLVMLRIAAAHSEQPGPGVPTRIDPEGVHFRGGEKNKEKPRIVKEGKFFADFSALEESSE